MQEIQIKFDPIHKEIGVAHTTIVRVLRGDEMDVPTIRKIAAWSGVMPSTLINSMADDDLSFPGQIALLLEKKSSSQRRTWEGY